MTAIQHVPSRKKLYLAAFAGNLLYVCSGCVMSWTSSGVVTRELIHGTEGSWLGSLYTLGAVFGPLFTSITLDMIGRKITLLTVLFVFFTSWILLLGSSLPFLYAGRVVGGLAVGATFSCVSVYLAEIADLGARGAVCSLCQVFQGAGMLLQVTVGEFVTVGQLVMISAVVPVVGLVCLLPMPESPYFLAARGKKEAALKAVTWLRNTGPDLVEAEVAGIQETVAEKSSAPRSDLLMNSSCRKALLISLLTMYCQQSSAAGVVLAFTQKIFVMANVPLEPWISSTIMALICIGSVLVAPAVVSRMGVRRTLIASCFGISVCLFVMGCYFFWEGDKSKTFNWVPMPCLFLFNLLLCIGVGPLPWAIVAELFPTNIKGFASGVIGILGSALSFCVVEVGGWGLLNGGTAWVFLVAGLAQLLGAVGLCFFLPDTKGLSFQQIQRLLEGGKRPSC